MDRVSLELLLCPSETLFLTDTFPLSIDCRDRRLNLSDERLVFLRHLIVPCDKHPGIRKFGQSLENDLVDLTLDVEYGSILGRQTPGCQFRRKMLIKALIDEKSPGQLRQPPEAPAPSSTSRPRP